MTSTPEEVLAGTAPFAVVCGDATEVLKSLPNNSISVCYCDPPYGLSSQNTADVLACLTAWLAGNVYTHHGPGFMGNDWDAFVPGPEAWREVYRVLKPGAYCVAYSSTRTVDLLGIAMRLGGLEPRNGWAWITGQGFPKNLDVGKALDKMAGATREVVGYDASRARPNRIGQSGALGNIGGKGVECDRTDNGATLTAPATDAEKQWDGYGTDVKPSYEPIVVTRKPLDGTVANNVLTHGTGALNINAARLHTTEVLQGGGGKLWSHYRDGTEDRAQPKVNDAQGRFPSSVALIHDEGCVGTTQVKGNRKDTRPEGDGGRDDKTQWRIRPTEATKRGFSDEDGLETTDVWDCTPTCAVAELERQSDAAGVHSAGSARGGGLGTEGRKSMSLPNGETNGSRYGDTGTAARFFYQCQPIMEREVLCGHCGLPCRPESSTITGCPPVLTATVNSKAEVAEGSAPKSVPASSPHGHGVSNPNENSNVGPVEKSGMTSPAAIGNSVPRSVQHKVSRQRGPSVSDAEDPVVSCGTDSVQDPVQPLPRSIHQPCLGVTSTEKPNSQTLSPNPVPVAIPVNTGTIPTIPNQKLWCGCVPPVTYGTITPGQPEGTASDPISRFRYSGKATNKERLAYLTCSPDCTANNTVAPAKQANASTPCPVCHNTRTVYLHPTVKPYELALYHAKLLSLPPHTSPIAIVPFCGTGVEARALLDVGYRVIAVDIDPRHVAMTRYRLSGDQPVQEKPVTVPQENTPTPETAPITLDDLFGF